jgi:hypothetical protein
MLSPLIDFFTQQDGPLALGTCVVTNQWCKVMSAMLDLLLEPVQIFHKNVKMHIEFKQWLKLIR